MSDAYVEVRDEPRHRRRFENRFVRVYDVLIPPGDTTLYHRHTEDTLYVAVNEATVRDRTFGEDGERTGTAPAGMILCRPHRSRPLIHQVHNMGEAEMRLIGAEIKDSPSDPSRPMADHLDGDGLPAVLEAPGLRVALERDRLRAYELELGPGESTGEVSSRLCALTIFLTVATVLARRVDGHERTSIHAPGDVVWEPAPERSSSAAGFTITNVGEESFRAVLGEWC